MPRWRGSGPALPAFVALALVAVLLASSTFTRSMAFQFLAVFVLFPAIVYLGACATLPVRLHRVCATLGNLSYPLYILHFPLIRPVDGRKMRSLTLHHPAFAHLILPVTCIYLAVIVWYAEEAYDLPVRKWLTTQYDRHVRSGA
jgi:peptidoglycan/LPS O-acetylase OafA/YrhL